MQPKPIYVIGGPPRTGTTWTLNALRALLETQGPVYPQDVEMCIDPDGKNLEAVLDEAEANPDRQYVIKTHHLVAGPYRYILNQRQWADTIESFALFMRMGTTEALTHLENFMLTDGHYAKQKELLVIPFGEIGTIGGVQNLACFAELPDDPQRDSLVQTRYSKASVEQLTAAITEGYEVTFTDGATRLIDKQTGFHQGHIQCM